MISNEKNTVTAKLSARSFKPADPASIIASPHVRTSIVLAWLAGHATLLAPTVLLADNQPPGRISLPALQNTPAGDRLMLREVSDSHIFRAEHTTRTVSQTREDTRKPAAVPGTVWEFIEQSRRLKIPAHERIAYYKKQYLAEAPWVSRIFRRAAPFAGHVVEELDKRYLPVELALLPVIESGYRPDVLSPKDAAGIWQIVPSTAQEIGITRNAWFDGRADIRQSTAAAINYLSYLNAEFHGDWMLTLAAYNAGPGRVRNAIRRNADAGLPTDFWSLRLPSETRNYVPKFLALVALLRDDGPRRLELAKIPRGTAFDLVDARQRVSLDKLSALTRIPEKALQQLNAGLVYGITPPEGPHLLYLPQGSGQRLVKKLIDQKARDLYTLPDSHTVVAGDTLSSLAIRYNISQRQLMELNALSSPLIRTGQTLRVMDLNNDRSKMSYVVTIGDNLHDIAKRFLIKIEDIRDENGQPLSTDIIHPGETLSLLTDAQPPRTN